MKVSVHFIWSIIDNKFMSNKYFRKRRKLRGSWQWVHTYAFYVEQVKQCTVQYMCQ